MVNGVGGLAGLGVQLLVEEESRNEPGNVMQEEQAMVESSVKDNMRNLKHATT